MSHFGGPKREKLEADLLLAQCSPEIEVNDVTLKTEIIFTDNVHRIIEYIMYMLHKNMEYM